MGSDEGYLLDILKAARRILLKTEGKTWEEFNRDEDLQDIVIRQLTLMGEASRKISSSMKELNPEIPWHKAYGMRNRLVHDYRNIDHEEVWRTTRRDVIEFAQLIEPLVPPEEEV